ncbi:hypothetical protein G6F42_018614 [Rhizopus arrhizus]|nr:hypothetical protein G6F42_018614 [Rhizopus arrhizus]
MSLKYFVEDGLGGVFNEDGSEAMDWDEERMHQTALEPKACDQARVDVVMAELEADIACSRKTYNIYTDEQKALFLYLLRFKFLKVKPAAERAAINPRAAQGWVKRMNEDPEWNIYGKLTNKVNRAGSQLQDEHKHFLINLFDEEPQATRKDAVDALTAEFEGFNLKESQKLS